MKNNKWLEKQKKAFEAVQKCDLIHCGSPLSESGKRPTLIHMLQETNLSSAQKSKIEKLLLSEFKKAAVNHLVHTKRAPNRTIARQAVQSVERLALPEELAVKYHVGAFTVSDRIGLPAKKKLKRD